MSEGHLTRKHRTRDGNRTGEGASLSTYDQAHDGERTDSEMHSPDGSVSFPTDESAVTVPSASNAGHSLINVPIMPRAESAAIPAGGLLSPDITLQAEAQTLAQWSQGTAIQRKTIRRSIIQRDDGSEGAADLDQEYNAAVQAGDWQTAAEKLNAFNTEDIKNRLAQLAPDQLVSLRQGALDNPRLGPNSQVAQLTTPSQSSDPNAQQANQPIDPNAQQPNQSTDPNAQQPDQSTEQAAAQAAIQELQSGETMFGVTIGITADLLALMGASGSGNPALNARNKDKYAYTEIKGRAFVKGAGDAADVDPNDIKQGDLGDCYLLAAMAAVARANPQAIRDLIKDNGDGTYDVTLYVRDHFWSSRSPHVIKVNSSFPTNKGGTPAYAGTGDVGPQGPELWPMLIEKAYAIYLGSYKDLDSGGHPGDAMEMLTNQDSMTRSPNDFSDADLIRFIAAALDPATGAYAVTAETDWEWRDLWSDDRTKDDAYKQDKVINLHAYAVKSADPAAGTIDLQNPWGSTDLASMSAAKFKKYFRKFELNKAR